jgi:hypothetical protein
MLESMFDFEADARTAVASGVFLQSFRDLLPPGVGAFDIDHYAPGKAIVWLVGIDTTRACVSATVRLVQNHEHAWAAESNSSESWDGWLEYARDRPEEAWPGCGPILALGYEGGSGEPGNAYYAVRGIASANIVGIEFGVGGHRRRRGIDSPTGAFVVAVPHPILDEPTILKITLRGGRTVNLNR